MMTDPTPRNDPATNWLYRLYETADDGWLTLFSIDRTSGERHTDWAHVDDLIGLADIAATRAHKCCVWHGVATRKERLPNGRRGGAADCSQLPGAWLDVDVDGPNHKGGHNLPPTIEAALELIADFPIPPTVIIHSGGGLQPWWLFPELVDAATVANMLPRWGATWDALAAKRGWHLDNVYDLARVMRLPGTYNRKGEPVPVTITGTPDWERRYPPDQIETHLGPTPEPPVPPVVDRVPYIGPERPGDAYDATHTPSSVMPTLGFHSPKLLGGDEHWVRAGKTPGQGYGAVVYGDDGHITIYSDTCSAWWPAVETRKPYTPFYLYAATHHNGDWQSASRALRDMGYGTPHQPDTLDWARIEPVDGVGDIPPQPPDDFAYAHLVDWDEFWAQDRAEQEWLIHPLIPAGRACALYAPAKAGKSSVLFAAVLAAVTGKGAFGGDPPATPIDILYLDYEMTETDLAERITELGYGPDDDLTRLHYALLPSIDPLDTASGAKTVLHLATSFNANLVVIETFGRAVEGEENSADTVRAYYRHLGLALKSAGIASLRTDHTGKDATKGQRGTSAKTDDVDVVWKLTRTETGATIKRTHSRISWVPEDIELNRIEDGNGVVTWAIREGRGYKAGTAKVAADLDRLGVPTEAGRERARKALKDAGVACRNDVLGDAVRWRKQEAQRLELEALGACGQVCDQVAGTGPGTGFLSTGRTDGGTGGDHPQKSRSNDGDRSGDSAGQAAPANGDNPPPLKRGGVPAAPSKKHLEEIILGKRQPGDIDPEESPDNNDPLI